MKLSDAQRLDWLRLIRSENIGPRTFRALVNRYGGAGPALEALPELAKRGGRTVTIATRESVEREFEALTRFGAKVLCLGEDGFPASLRAVDSPPPVLIVLGDLSVFARPAVAIVGSRNASAAGLAFAARMAGELAAQDFVIASGLARGIDARAHHASLNSGTIAVLAGGLDRIYPAEHEKLARDICERGALVSEMPLGWEARGRDFPRRNRIVSGLSLGTLVIEAARRSGSLITARFAAEQGREVFAVPGSPLDPRAEGANDLLRQGATLCTQSSDVIDALAPLLRNGLPAPGMLFESAPNLDAPEPLWDELDLFAEPAPTTLAGHEMDEDPALPLVPPDFNGTREAFDDPAETAARVEGLLGPSPVNVDDLARLSGASVADVRMILLDLDLQGRIERHGGNLVSLIVSADHSAR
ncbi:MAG: dprA [Hyphomicrobiales bacterium]|nr:dprA [Hyphomicrobiales bacterium]